MTERQDLVENEVVRNLIWAGLMAVVGAIASIVARRGAEAIWVRVFDEEPPEK